MNREDGSAWESSPHARMASAIILAAREAVSTAGMSRDEFVAYVGDALDDDVPLEEFEFWEIGGGPPADVMLVCAVVIREAVANNLPIAEDIRSAALQMSWGLPWLPPGDPVRDLLYRGSE